MIKLFNNVPKADLEMLFPNSEVRMKTIDKLIIGIPAAVSGAILVVSKLGASLALVGALVAFWLGLRETSGGHQPKNTWLHWGLGWWL